MLKLSRFCWRSRELQTHKILIGKSVETNGKLWTESSFIVKLESLKISQKKTENTNEIFQE